MSSGTWSYDGSVEGLLILAHRALSSCEYPEAVANALAADGELFALLGPAPLTQEPQVEDPVDLAVKAERAASGLRSFAPELFDMTIRVWMSEEAFELPLFRLCARAGERGWEVLGDHGDPDLRAIALASKRVYHETCRLQGFARFEPGAQEIMTARIEPQYNVAAALLPHFARRFGEEDFAIVDLRRRLGFLRRRGRLDAFTGEAALALAEPTAAQAEADEELMLWKRYFKATENPARANPELQRRLMPRRYWKYLPEMRG
jgi:probable DNA metabolism protein